MNAILARFSSMISTGLCGQARKLKTVLEVSATIVIWVLAALLFAYLFPMAGTMPLGSP